MALELRVPNLACSACVETVTKAVQSVDATAQVTADTKTKRVNIVTNTSETTIKNAITAAGYPVT